MAPDVTFTINNEWYTAKPGVFSEAPAHTIGWKKAGKQLINVCGQELSVTFKLEIVVDKEGKETNETNETNETKDTTDE